MRIGIDAQSLEGQRTGVGRYLSELLNRFEKLAKPQVEFFLYFRKEIPNDIRQNAHFRSKILPKVLGRSSRAFFMHRAIPAAFRKDMINTGFFPEYIAPLFLSTPFVLTLHDIVYAARPEFYFWPSLFDRWLLGKVSRHAAQKARIILVPSEFTKKEVVRIFNIPASRILITSEAAGEEFSPHIQPDDTAIVELLGITSRFILFVGSIFTRRNLPACIAAFTTAARKIPDLQFLIAGRNRTRPFIDIDALALETNQTLGRHAIVRVPFISPQNLPSVFRKASALIWVSAYEGFGLPVLEALASGCPVITSKNASLAEVAGEAALFVENPSDTNAILKHLERVLTDESLVRDLATKGQERAHTFSWDACAKTTLDALLHL